MKIIENFLNKEEFESIKNIVMGKYFPYYYKTGVAREEDEDFFFSHVLYDSNEPRSNYFNIIKPILLKINPLSLIKSRVNCYPKSETLLKHKQHIDYKFSHKGAIYSINTCNGGTYIGDKFIPSFSNQILLFDPSKLHQSTNCTDENCRFNIVINFF